MAKKKEQASVREQLLDAVKRSGLTPYMIAKRAGTTPEVVGRFVKGADIRLSTASKIAEVLELELKPKQ